MIFTSADIDRFTDKLEETKRRKQKSVLIMMHPDFYTKVLADPNFGTTLKSPVTFEGIKMTVSMFVDDFFILTKEMVMEVPDEDRH